MDAEFRHGNPLMIDYTADADIAVGEVVVIGSIAANTTGEGFTCGVAHLAIANGALGSLAAGGGVYDVINLNNAANGAKVYWDNTNKKVTTTSTNNAQFGFVVSGGGGGANSTAKVLHHPYA